MVSSHPQHETARFRVQQAQKGADTGIIAAHSLAEVYSILTRLPVQPRISPLAAHQLIQHNILGTFEIVTLTDVDYISLLNHLRAEGIAGGATYDALLLHAAWTSNVDQILTLNEKDFRRVYPILADKIATP